MCHASAATRALFCTHTQQWREGPRHEYVTCWQQKVSPSSPSFLPPGACSGLLPAHGAVATQNESGVMAFLSQQETPVLLDPRTSESGPGVCSSAAKSQHRGRPPHMERTHAQRHRRSGCGAVLTSRPRRRAAPAEDLAVRAGAPSVRTFRLCTAQVLLMMICSGEHRTERMGGSRTAAQRPVGCCVLDLEVPKANACLIAGRSRRCPRRKAGGGASIYPSPLQSRQDSLHHPSLAPALASRALSSASASLHRCPLPSGLRATAPGPWRSPLAATTHARGRRAGEREPGLEFSAPAGKPNSVSTNHTCSSVLAFVLAVCPAHAMCV